MRYEYFYCLINPERPVNQEWAEMLRNNGWRLHMMAALPDGRIYAAFERETA